LGLSKNNLQLLYCHKFQTKTCVYRSKISVFFQYYKLLFSTNQIHQAAKKFFQPNHHKNCNFDINQSTVAQKFRRNDLLPTHFHLLPTLFHLLPALFRLLLALFALLSTPFMLLSTLFILLSVLFYLLPIFYE
jgi:hypothetical protein